MSILGEVGGKGWHSRHQHETFLRIRSHLSVQEENVGRKSKSSTSSQGTQEEAGKPIASEPAKARDSQIRRYFSFLFANNSAIDTNPWWMIINSI